MSNTNWRQLTAYESRTAQENTGLSSKQAKALLKKHGPNTFAAVRHASLIEQFIHRFRNPLVLILLMASVVSALTGELANFAIISGIVLMSISLDFFQEFKANTAAEKLRQSVAVKATVLRNGVPQEIRIEEMVPGDVAWVTAGDLIPADAWVVEAKDFFVNQSTLTGEAFPVEKKPELLVQDSTEGLDAPHAVFMGTFVISGSARLLIYKTGKATEIGQIAQSIQGAEGSTSFDRGAHKFGMLILWLTLVLVLFVLLVNAWFHKPWLESFLFAVALAVGLTPELLPMVISVTLSRGAIRLSKLKMIVKRQTAIQDLGSMDVLCTDKTGTLTEAHICLELAISPTGEDSQKVFQMAYLNSYFETGLKSPLDAAILDHQPMDVGGWRKIDEIPFAFERRCVSVLLDNGEKRLLIVKGAAEEIVKLCTHIDCANGSSTQTLNDDLITAIKDRYLALEADGLRVLGIAWREVPKDQAAAVITDETGLAFAGFTAFLDPPKAGASEALSKLQKAGIAIKVVTGDSDLVTRHVCQQLGIQVQGVLMGHEIEQLDSRSLQRRVEQANLFCRVSPSQKERVILALKANRHVVGYLGDGINDAPSLHSADVGLSVDSAVDVAKLAADMILLEHDLSVIYDSVLEGRRTFGNILKYIMMGTSSNFGNMFSMAGAALWLPFLPMLPTQILLNNILYDISEIPIPLDEVDMEEMQKPRVLDLHFIRNFMLVIGPISSVFDFFTFYVLLNFLNADEKLFQTGWFIESLCTQVLVIFIIRTRGWPFKSRPHPVLTVTSLGVVAIALLLPLTPVGPFFGFVAPPPIFYGVLMAVVLIYLLIVEWTKRIFYKQLG